MSEAFLADVWPDVPLLAYKSSSTDHDTDFDQELQASLIDLIVQGAYEKCILEPNLAVCFVEYYAN